MESFFKQAVQCHKSGQVKQAIKMYKQLLEQQPKQAVVNARLAIAYTQVQNFRAAMPHFLVAVESLQDDLDLLIKGADCAIQCGDHDSAEKWLRRYVSDAPDNFPVIEALAGVLIAKHNEQDALPLIERCLKAKPRSASLLNLKGLVLARSGELRLAYECFKQALSEQPGNLGAIRNALTFSPMLDKQREACSLNDGREFDQDLFAPIMAKLEAHYAQLAKNDALKMNIAYTLFDYYEKQDAATAFTYLKAANDINASLSPYIHQRTQELFSRLAASFPNEMRNKVTDQCLDNAPIFIVGMPRSGTTLVEQILSAHSDVCALGEVDFLRQSFEKFGATVLNETIPLEKKIKACELTVANYLARAKALVANANGKALRFTDKMPYNFMLLGLIALFLPKAKIIHCTREPLETCFSIYKHNLSGSHGFTNNLSDLGKYYNLYESMMGRWKQQFGAQIYDVSYESLVASPEHETNKLLAFCGLTTEDACFRPHENKRLVRTASSAQVRQPIYQHSVRASAPFEAFLGPLSEVLLSKEGGELQTSKSS